MAGFFDGFVGGAADQATGILNNQMQDERQRAYAQFQADLQEKKERALMILRQEMQDAPLNRFGSKAKEFAGQDVPLEAEKVAPVTKTGGILNPGEMTGVDGKPIQMQGGTDRGLATGVTEGAGPDGPSKSIAEMRAQIASQKSISEDPVNGISDEDRAGVLRQLDAQAAQENQKNMADANAAVAGKTRKRTNDEALGMAADDAKVNDPVAYAEYQARIGKPLRDERRVDNQEKREETRDATTNRRLDIQQQFNEDRAKYQEKLAAIQEARAGRLEGRQEDQATKAEMQNTRNALTSVLKDIGTQEDKIQMKMMDPMLTPEQKSVLESQFKTLDRDRVNARNELMKLAGIEPKGADAAPAKNGWDSGTGQVYKNGEIIGTAKSEQEGRALYQGGATTLPASKKAPTESAKPGYTPPEDSPAGRAAAMREKATAGIAQKQAAELQSVSDLASQALASKDPEAAMRAQDAPGFGRLDAATKAAIFKLVNGR